MDSSFVQNIINFDHWLFQQINSVYTSSVFDLVMPWLTDLNKNPLLPVVLILLMVFWIFKQRVRALMYILILILAVGGSDLLAYRVVKSVAQRARPEQAGMNPVLRTTHHSGTSFPSNHAANAFAAASVLSSAFPVATPLFFLIAALIAYSRVYVGVHFPIDVVAGALMGWIIAFFLKVILNQQIVKAELSEDHRFEREYNAKEKARRKELLKRDKVKK